MGKLGENRPYRLGLCVCVCVNYIDFLQLNLCLHGDRQPKHLPMLLLRDRIYLGSHELANIEPGIHTYQAHKFRHADTLRVMIAFEVNEKGAKGRMSKFILT